MRCCRLIAGCCRSTSRPGWPSGSCNSAADRAVNVRGRLEAGPDGLRRVADDLLAAHPGTQQRRLLVTIDQAEELFTRTTPAALQRFAQLLRDAVAGPVHVVAAMRSEFLDDLCNEKRYNDDHERHKEKYRMKEEDRDREKGEVPSFFCVQTVLCTNHR